MFFIFIGTFVAQVYTFVNTYQYSCLENPMNSMKRQKDRTLKDELLRSVGAQYATGRSGEIAPERMKRRSQSKNSTQLWI